MSESYGTIYLLQPREYIETDVYKIGLSHKNDLKRCLSYGKDTKFISIHECKNPRVIENIIKDEFNNKFEKCKGHEYFKGNISEIYKLFNKLVIDYNNKDDCDEASCAYEADVTDNINNDNINNDNINNDNINNDNINNDNNINLKQIKIENSKKKTKYYCDLCNFRTNLKENYRNHNLTNKHKKKVYESKEHKCDLCFYSTSSYRHFQKHLETQKHKRKVIEEKKEQKNDSKNNKETIKMLVDEIKGKDKTIQEIMYKMYENQKNMYENQIEDIKKTMLMQNHTNI